MPRIVPQRPEEKNGGDGAGLLGVSGFPFLSLRFALAFRFLLLFLFQIPLSLFKLIVHVCHAASLPSLFILTAHVNARVAVSVHANPKLNGFTAHLAIFDVVLLAH